MLGRYLQFALATCVLTFAFSPARADEVSWQTLAALEFPVDTRVAFQEARKTRLQREEKIQNGELWITAGGAMVMAIDGPRQELRQIKGTSLSLTRGEKVRRTELNPNKGAHQLLLVIIDVLRGDVRRLQQNFRIAQPTMSQEKIAAATQNKGWLITLEPSADVLQKQMSALVLRGKGSKLELLRTERGSSYQQILLDPKGGDPVSQKTSEATGKPNEQEADLQ